MNLPKGYKVYPRQNGSAMWRRGNKIISQKDVPDEIKKEAKKELGSRVNIHFKEEAPSVEETIEEKKEKVVEEDVPTYEEEVIEGEVTDASGEDVEPTPKKTIERRPDDPEETKQHEILSKKLEELEKRCIFCGKYGDSARSIGLRKRVYVVRLCTDHYYSETMGRIAEKLNKLLKEE